MAIGSTDGIEYCSQMNSDFVYGRIPAVKRRGGFQDNATWKPMSSNVMLRNTDIIIWRGIMLVQRTGLLHFAVCFTAELHVKKIILDIIRPLLQAALGTLFQVNNAQAHIARLTLNSMDGIHILLRPKTSPLMQLCVNSSDVSCYGYWRSTTIIYHGGV